MTAAFDPVGDPEAMRSLARELMGRADLISSTAISPASALSGATFEGPSAIRLRHALDAARRDALDAATRLRDVASDLSAGAAEVERENLWLEQEAEARAAEAAEAAANAADDALPAADEPPSPAAGAAPAAPAAPAPAAPAPEALPATDQEVPS